MRKETSASLHQIDATNEEDTVSVQLKLSRSDITCPITQMLFFEPTVTGCGHHFETNAPLQYANEIKHPRCPCCRADDITLHPVSDLFKSTLDSAMAGNSSLWKDVYFDLDYLAKTLEHDNKLASPTGQRFLTLLLNASNHLTENALVGKFKGKSAIEIFASTSTGRDILRQHVRCDMLSDQTQQYFFGRALIPHETLAISINGETIKTWLSINTALEQCQTAEKCQRETLEDEWRYELGPLQKSFSLGMLFLSRKPSNVLRNPTNHRVYHDGANTLLKHVTNGQLLRVKRLLRQEHVHDPIRLNAWLCGISVTQDHADRWITSLTPLQAAAHIGDAAMCTVISDYLSENEITKQFQEVFPTGLDHHQSKQAVVAFNFNGIASAIKLASPSEVNKALQKTHASLTQAYSAREKPAHKLTLTETLNRFREQFIAQAMRERNQIFNPYHFVNVINSFKRLCDDLELNQLDRNYKKRNLFWRQVLGFVQRFLSAFDAYSTHH